MNDDVRINDVRQRIVRQKAVLSGALNMRASTDNPSVQSGLDNEIRESRRNIDYLEARLKELQLSRTDGSTSSQASSVVANSASPGQSRSTTRQQAGRGYSNDPSSGSIGHHGGDEGGYGDPGPGGYSSLDAPHNTMPPRAPFSAPPPGSNVGRVRPTYSRLGVLSFYLTCAEICTDEGDRPHQVGHASSGSTNSTYALSTRIQA